MAAFSGQVNAGDLPPMLKDNQGKTIRFSKGKSSLYSWCLGSAPWSCIHATFSYTICL